MIEGENQVENEREPDALFQIEGPDEDGWVWACSAEGRDVWCQNLGPKERVAEVFSQWLASIYGGRGRLAVPSDRRIGDRVVAADNHEEDISEECWGRIEGVRQRVKTICAGAAQEEHASIDAELMELQDFVLTALDRPQRPPVRND